MKAYNDKSLYDISFNGSIQHLRHALALNEDRRHFEPEYLFPDDRQLTSTRRSIIQAWFLGTHIDIGGSAAKDGLALYPLQWLLIESRDKGLILQHVTSYGNRAVIEDPLDLAFPPREDLGKGVEMASSQAKNKLEVHMQDLRRVHVLKSNGTRHGIHINRSRHPFILKEPRDPFTVDGVLKGYCEYG